MDAPYVDHNHLLFSLLRKQTVVMDRLEVNKRATLDFERRKEMTVASLNDEAAMYDTIRQKNEQELKELSREIKRLRTLIREQQRKAESSSR